MARTGRPPGWIVGLGGRSLPVVEPATVKSKRRLTLPLHGRALSTWLAHSRPTEAVLALSSQGRITLSPGDRFDEQLRLAEGTLGDMTEHEREKAKALLRTKFMYVTVNEAGRLVIPPLAAAFLAVGDDRSTTLYVAFFKGRLELWNQDYVETVIDEDEGEFSELLNLLS